MSKDESYYNAETFEEKIKALIPNLTEHQFIQGAEQVVFMCKCSICPTFKSGSETKVARCILGKINSPLQNKICLCTDCPYSKMMNLRWDHFCLQGNALDLSDYII